MVAGLFQVVAPSLADLSLYAASRSRYLPVVDAEWKQPIGGRLVVACSSKAAALVV